MPDDAVFDAVQLMNRHHVGAAVVLDQGRVTGILTERDILMRIVATGRSPHYTAVNEVMTRDPLCVDKSMLAQDVMALATDRRCRHFPVVEDGQLIGLISIGDLVNLAIQDREHLIHAGILAIKAMSGR